MRSAAWAGSKGTAQVQAFRRSRTVPKGRNKEVVSYIIMWVQAHIRSERGQDLIEYAMLSGLIAAAIVAVGILLFTGALNSLITGIGDCIDFDTVTPCNPGF